MAEPEPETAAAAEPSPEPAAAAAPVPAAEEGVPEAAPVPAAPEAGGAYAGTMRRRLKAFLAMVESDEGWECVSPLRASPRRWLLFRPALFRSEL